MKIAVPTRGKEVDGHFGGCEMYSVFTIGDSGTIDKVEILPATTGCGCKSNIAGVLQQMGVGILLAGNMGNGALNILQSHGIDVYRGCSGNAFQVVEKFLLGGINDSGKGCAFHQHHEGENSEHQCNH